MRASVAGREIRARARRAAAGGWSSAGRTRPGAGGCPKIVLRRRPPRGGRILFCVNAGPSASPRTPTAGDSPTSPAASCSPHPAVPRACECRARRGGPASSSTTAATDYGGAHRFDTGHKEKGWDGLGYHFVIGNGSDTRTGLVEVGPRWARRSGAHCRSPGLPQRARNWHLPRRKSSTRPPLRRAAGQPEEAFVLPLPRIRHPRQPLHARRRHRADEVPGKAFRFEGAQVREIGWDAVSRLNLLRA